MRRSQGQLGALARRTLRAAASMAADLALDHLDAGGLQGVVAAR
jgi:hypothetical protein